jgi:predicted RNA methylase
MTFALLGRDLFGEPVKPRTAPGPLAQAFTLPPFSVLDARSGPWRERKRAWLSLGIKSEIGRNDDEQGAGSLNISESARKLAGGYEEPEGEMKQASGTSVFDPVLCELCYRWFAPPGGHVLDPFAGGSVRGITAALLGLRYTGIELRAEQVAANREQAGSICPGGPEWIEGDSRAVRGLAPRAADFLFSCPPYGDLERYSDDPRDLSTLDYAAFLSAYREIVAASCAVLAADRFAAFVVGEIRGKDGHYRNFVGDTVAAFAAAGLRFYNEAILLTAVGSLPIRVSRSFPAGRKLGKSHQNVLVFVKGDWRKAAAACNGGADVA